MAVCRYVVGGGTRALARPRNKSDARSGRRSPEMRLPAWLGGHLQLPGSRFLSKAGLRRLRRTRRLSARPQPVFPTQEFRPRQLTFNYAPAGPLVCRVARHLADRYSPKLNSPFIVSPSAMPENV